MSEITALGQQNTQICTQSILHQTSGVHVSELCQNDFRQLSLFEKDYEKQRTVDRAVDSIRERYGNGSVFRSAFLNSGVRFSTGGTVDEGEYPMMSSIL